MLEHHAHLLPMQIDVALGVGDIHTLKEYGSVRGMFQKIQAPQEGGFSAAGGTDHNDDLALADLVGDAVEGLDRSVAEMLFQILYGNQYVSGHWNEASFPACPPAR